MKLKTTEKLSFYEVIGVQQTVQIQIPPGIYTVEIKNNPSGRNYSEWYVFTKPEEIGPTFKNKIIGAAKEWVENNKSISKLPYFR